MNAAPRTILIMAGGTGGHVMPGLAVAAEMRQRQWNVVWLGNPGGMEANLVPRHGIAMEPVRIGGLRGKSLATMALMPLVLLRAFWQSLRALRRTKPSVVLGMGGYVAFPGGMMAVLTGRPLVVHEQNSVAGLTNRMLAKVADRVLQAFPGAFPKATVCGNPVRAEVAALPEPAVRYAGRSGPLRLLVVGGSLGAQVFNQTVPAALAQIEPAQRPVVIHQTGRGRRDEVQARYDEAGVEAQVVEFIDDMAAAYGDVDLALCRAGAMTVSELAAAGVASVLVPFPHAVDDHQTGNARYLSEGQAAVLLPQTGFDATSFARLLTETDREGCAQMAQAARALARIDATATVADACERLGRKP